MHFLASLIWRLTLIQDTGSLGFGFKLIISFWRSMQIVFTDRVLPIIRCRDQVGGDKVSPCSMKITVAICLFCHCPEFALH